MILPRLSNQPISAYLLAAMWLSSTLALTLTSPSLFAQDSFEPPTMGERLSDLVYMNWLRSEEIGKCVDCHLTPSLGTLISGEKDRFGTFSRRNEMERWLTQDKHTIARRRVEPFLATETREQLTNMLRTTAKYRSELHEDLTKAGIKVEVGELTFDKFPEHWVGMSNVLSRRMCDKLWGEGAVKKADGYANFRDKCLTCHGGYEPGDKGFDFVDMQNGAQLGIDCNHCHQEGKNDRWVDIHDKPARWRLRTPGSKSAEGMRDLVDTSNQAKLCADCHIGNRNKGMFVDHEMYAAGHPPLPSIEIETFCKEMPQHWQTPKQLYKSLEKYTDRDQYFRINYPGLTERIPAKDVYWNTRKMLIGAIQSRIASLELYEGAITNHEWADYALYDCASCHHELQSQSLRQRRGFVGAPGRPRTHEWFDVLLDTALLLGNPADATTVRRLEANLQREMSEVPFGRPESVAPIAKQMVSELAQIAEFAERQPIDEAIARNVLRKLVNTPMNRLISYDSARQLAWAIRTISNELEQNNAALDAKVRQLISELNAESFTGLELSIPSGRSQFIYRESLAADLKRRSEFDPDGFARKLRQIVSAQK